MNTESNVGNQSQKTKNDCLKIIIEESLKIFDSDSEYQFFADKGVECGKNITAPSYSSISVLTPVAPFSMEGKNFSKTCKQLAQNFLTQKMTCEDVKSDFCFTIGFFSEFMKHNKYSLMSQTDAEEIINSTITFMDRIVIEMTKQILKDLR